VSEGNWRGAFWAFSAQGLVAVTLAPLFLKKLSRVQKEKSHAIPFARLSLLGISVLLVCHSSVITNVAISIIICLIGIAILVFFFKRDSVSQNSIFPRGILNPFSDSGSGLLMMSSLFMATISLTVYGPLLMYIIFGVPPLIAGYIIALESIAWTILAVVTSGVREHIESLLIKFGAFLVSISLVGLIFTMPSGPIWSIALFSTFMGMGFGMSWSFVSKRVIASFPENERMQASGSIPTFMRMAMALGSAFSGIIANFSGFSEESSIFVAKNVAFWSFTAFLPLITVGLFFAWRVSRN